MGNGILKRRTDAFTVFADEESAKDPKIPGLARSMFKKFEWQTLQLFCEKYKITQPYLNIVFNKWLTYEEVYVQDFRVRTKDLKQKFLLGSKLMRELADGVIPLYLMREFPGLEAPYSNDEVSFARFCIMSYLFCSQQIPDLIHDFVTLIREKLKLSLTARVHTYSLDQMAGIMLEDFVQSAAGQILKAALGRLGKEDDMEILSIVKLGCKYPLLFYAVERFRKHLKRQAFGERFWQGRATLKLKLDAGEDGGALKNVHVRYVDENAAIRETSKAIIFDAMKMGSPQYHLSEDPAPPVIDISPKCEIRLKNLFGYERARQLIIDSEIEFPDDILFLSRAMGEDVPVSRPIRGLDIFPREIEYEFLDYDTESDDDYYDEDDEDYDSDDDEYEDGDGDGDDSEHNSGGDEESVQEDGGGNKGTNFPDMQEGENKSASEDSDAFDNVAEHPLMREDSDDSMDDLMKRQGSHRLKEKGSDLSEYLVSSEVTRPSQSHSHGRSKGQGSDMSEYLLPQMTSQGSSVASVGHPVLSRSRSSRLKEQSSDLSEYMLPPMTTLLGQDESPSDVRHPVLSRSRSSRLKEQSSDLSELSLPKLTRQTSAKGGIVASATDNQRFMRQGSDFTALLGEATGIIDPQTGGQRKVNRRLRTASSAAPSVDSRVALLDALCAEEEQQGEGGVPDQDQEKAQTGGAATAGINKKSNRISKRGSANTRASLLLPSSSAASTAVHGEVAPNDAAVEENDTEKPHKKIRRPRSRSSATRASLLSPSLATAAAAASSAAVEGTDPSGTAPADCSPPVGKSRKQGRTRSSATRASLLSPSLAAAAAAASSAAVEGTDPSGTAPADGSPPVGKSRKQGRVRSRSTSSSVHFYGGEEAETTEMGTPVVVQNDGIDVDRNTSKDNDSSLNDQTNAEVDHTHVHAHRHSPGPHGSNSLSSRMRRVFSGESMGSLKDVIPPSLAIATVPGAAAVLAQKAAEEEEAAAAADDDNEKQDKNHHHHPHHQDKKSENEAKEVDLDTALSKLSAVSSPQASYMSSPSVRSAFQKLTVPPPKHLTRKERRRYEEDQAREEKRLLKLAQEPHTAVLDLDDSQLVMDPRTMRTFAYDPVTGKSAWVVAVLDEDGDVALEHVM